MQTINKVNGDKLRGKLSSTSTSTLQGLVIFLAAISSFTVSATAITASMSPEVAAEFNKQLALQTSSNKAFNLTVMTNPYKKFTKINKKKASKEAEVGHHRRLRTHEESITSAKQSRFGICQDNIVTFVSFAVSAHTYSTANQPLTKDKIMNGNGVAYPFTEKEANDGYDRAVQIALEFGWKYQGKPSEGKAEKHVEDFFITCLAIPMNLYYYEDTFREDE